MDDWGEADRRVVAAAGDYGWFGDWGLLGSQAARLREPTFAEFRRGTDGVDVEVGLQGTYAALFREAWAEVEALRLRSTYGRGALCDGMGV